MKRFSVRDFVLIKNVDDSLFTVASFLFIRHIFLPWMMGGGWRGRGGASAPPSAGRYASSANQRPRRKASSRLLARWHDTTTWPGKITCHGFRSAESTKTISSAVSLRLFVCSCSVQDCNWKRKITFYFINENTFTCTFLLLQTYRYMPAYCIEMQARHLQCLYIF